MVTRQEVVAEAERGLVGGALQDAGYVVPRAIEEQVQADWFGDEKLRMIWRAIEDVFREYGSKADNVSFSMLVLERLQKNGARVEKDGREVGDVSIQDFMRSMEGLAVVSQLEYHVNILRQEVMMRRLASAQLRMAEEVRTGAAIPDAIGQLNVAINDILAVAMGRRTIAPSDVLQEVLNQYAEAHRIRIDEGRMDYTPGLPLPWQCVNLKSNGVQEGLYYLGARPSVGKTMFVCNIIRYWCERGVHVGFDSLDMAATQLTKRILGEHARVSFNKASFGTTTQEDLRSMEKSATVIKSWPLSLIEFRDVDKLRAWALAMRAAKKLDVLIIDFVQLLRPAKHFNNTEERLEYVSGVLKSIALDLRMPVIALSQLNRECEKDGGRVPTASDLRGSGALEQDAFAVWILHMEKEVKNGWLNPNPTLPESQRTKAPIGFTAGNTIAEFRAINPVRFIIAKNQNGQAGQSTWFPFIFYNKYAAVMLADYNAQPTVTQTGYGATAKQVQDFSPLYARVHSDWRHDALEVALKNNNVLIDDEGRAEEFNRPAHQAELISAPSPAPVATTSAEPSRPHSAYDEDDI